MTFRGIRLEAITERVYGLQLYRKVLRATSDEATFLETTFHSTQTNSTGSCLITPTAKLAFKGLLLRTHTGTDER